jgi:hypothetical protein
LFGIYHREPFGEDSEIEFIHAMTKEPDPARWTTGAFDVVPPQTRDFLDSCATQGIAVRTCAPEAKHSDASRITFPSAREELEAAVSWARARLEAGAKRIGVVVPELGQRRKEVARVFARYAAGP